VLRRFAAEHDVIMIDLPRLLSKAPQPRAEYFQDQIHPNSEGHRLIAEAALATPRARWPQ